MANDSWSEYGTGKFLKADDFQNNEERVFTIASIGKANVPNKDGGQDEVTVLNFQDESAMIIKPTNLAILRELFPRPSQALGSDVVVWKDPNVTFAGRRTGGLRIKAAQNPNRNGTGDADSSTGSATGTVTDVDARQITKEFIRLGLDKNQAGEFIGLQVPGKNTIHSLTGPEKVKVLGAAKAM